MTLHLFLIQWLSGVMLVAAITVPTYLLRRKG